MAMSNAGPFRFPSSCLSLPFFGSSATIVGVAQIDPLRADVQVPVALQGRVGVGNTRPPLAS